MAFVLVAACGGQLSPGGATTRDAGADASLADAASAALAPDGQADGAQGPVDGGSARAPPQHRHAPVTCTDMRPAGPGQTPCGCTEPDGGSCCLTPDGGECMSDSDCDAGIQGRCGVISTTGIAQCVYDECADDSQCDGAPCSCSNAASFNAVNLCLTGSNCRVDSDCGLAGYCSPSMLELSCICIGTGNCGDAAVCYAGSTQVPCSCNVSCGHGYFCHTPADTCLTTSDCVQGGICAYDTASQRWDCVACIPHL
jgi:hypothetical protein